MAEMEEMMGCLVALLAQWGLKRFEEIGGTGKGD